MAELNPKIHPEFIDQVTLARDTQFEVSIDRYHDFKHPLEKAIIEEIIMLKKKVGEFAVVEENLTRIKEIITSSRNPEEMTPQEREVLRYV